MAVTCVWAVSSNVSDVSNYIANPEKTIISTEDYIGMHTADVISDDMTEKLCLVRGINCSPKHAVEQFAMVREQYDKNNIPVIAYHGCISFVKDEVTPQETVAIAKEFVESMWGNDHQILLSAHLNTQHLHCHFLINSVSFTDGHILHDEKAWFIFSKKADEICKKYNKSVIGDPDRSHKKVLTDRESACITCIDKALADSTSYAEFLSNIQKEPCTVNFAISSAVWTIIPDGWTIPVVTDTLGKNYGKDAILSRYPEVEEVAEKFTIPSVLERVDFVGYQTTVAHKVQSVISNNVKYDEREPNKTYLPRKVKKQVENMAKGLEVMVKENITSLPDLNRYILLQNNRIKDLKKRLSDVPESELSEITANINAMTANVRAVSEIKDAMTSRTDDVFDVATEPYVNKDERGNVK